MRKTFQTGFWVFTKAALAQGGRGSGMKTQPAAPRLISLETRQVACTRGREE
jgi:hypothetical protein